MFVKENVRLVAVENDAGKVRKLDYYIQCPGRGMVYAFSRKYTNRTFALCRAGIRVNALACRRSHNKGVMGLVSHMNRMLPYLKEWYDLPAACGS